MTMMKCGHAANAKVDGRPVCVICALRAEGREVDEDPDLTGRTARCECGNTRPSSTALAFFEHLPDRDTDRYYCGCWGWD